MYIKTYNYTSSLIWRTVPRLVDDYVIQYARSYYNIIIIMCVTMFFGHYLHWPGGFMVLWFYVQEHPNVQLTVVLVLKHLRRWGHGLKSHPTDWESRDSWVQGE